MGYDGIHDLPRHMVVVGVRVGVIDHLRWTLWLHAPRLLSMSAQRKEHYNNPQWKPKQVAHAPCVQPGGPALLIWRNFTCHHSRRRSLRLRYDDLFVNSSLARRTDRGQHFIAMASC